MPAFLLLLALNLGLALSQDAKTGLSGIVKDFKTGTPLENAEVTVLINLKPLVSTKTDKEGKFHLNLPKSGVYAVEFRASGYAGVRFVDIFVEQDKTRDLTIALKKSGVLEELTVKNYRAGEMNELSADEDAAAAGSSTPSGRYKSREGGRPAAKSDKMMKTTGAPAERKYTREAEAAPAVSEMSEVVVMDVASGESIKPAGEPARPVDPSKPLDPIRKLPETPSQPAPRAGLLTAGEWNDLHNWKNHWLDLLSDGEIESWQKMYNFYPSQRYTVLLVNTSDIPVVDVPVRLYAGAELLWECRTDNTGKAELWAGLNEKKTYNGLRIEAVAGGRPVPFAEAKPAAEGINRIVVDQPCQAPNRVDIVWAVDATGSMGDEIEYLKTELLDVIGRAKSLNKGLDYRMGTVFYRDQGDEYITKSSALSSDISKTVDFIRAQFAGGGGDYPEAVENALEEAIMAQPWSEEAVARICFLVLDASPHQNPEINARMAHAVREAARKGIRIVPVAASGIQKDTEFLMKFFGLATNGTYVFLTDHSGIGGKHLEPTSDVYKVEPLNDLLVRLIGEYTALETCEGQSVIRFEEDPQQPRDENWKALYYPNPATTQFTLELPVAVASVALYDAEGKGVRRLENPAAGPHVIPVADLDPGFYTIRILCNGKMQSGKLMVMSRN